MPGAGSRHDSDHAAGVIARALLTRPGPQAGICVALSGGPHSTGVVALLAALRDSGQLAEPLRAVHVTHGLSEHAQDWAEQAHRSARQLGLDCQVLQVDARAQPGGDGPEAAARNARYAALAAQLGADELLVTGHHQGDQAETVLARLFRGAGAHGLTAMRSFRRIGPGWLARPALALAGEALAAQATAAGLAVCHDPSNLDPRLGRGWLRTQLAPVLDEHDPGWQRSLASSAASLADVVEVADELARIDLALIRTAPDSLDCAALLALPGARRRLALHAFVRAHGLRPPARRFHHQLERECLLAKADANPIVRWPDGEFRRFRNQLHLLAGAAIPPPHPGLQWSVAVQPPAAVELPWGRLVFESQAHHRGMRSSSAVVSGSYPGAADQPASPGLCLERLSAASCEVRLRRGGERFAPFGSTHHRALKKWLNESTLPPWRRPWLPLLYCNGELAAVPGLGVSQALAARPGDAALRLDWELPQPDAR